MTQTKLQPILEAVEEVLKSYEDLKGTIVKEKEKVEVAKENSSVVGEKTAIIENSNKSNQEIKKNEKENEVKKPAVFLQEPENTKDEDENDDFRLHVIHTRPSSIPVAIQKQLDDEVERSMTIIPPRKGKRK
jgi:hypothetical protein